MKPAMDWITQYMLDFQRDAYPTYGHPQLSLLGSAPPHFSKYDLLAALDEMQEAGLVVSLIDPAGVQVYQLASLVVGGAG